MSEEKKAPAGGVEEKKQCSCPAKSFGKFILGILIVACGLWAVIGWWSDLLVVVRGCLGLLLLMIGAITIAIAKD